jgi:hypothetical protein
MPPCPAFIGQNGVLSTFYSGWLQTTIFPISTSRIAGITQAWATAPGFQYFNLCACTVIFTVFYTVILR